MKKIGWRLCIQACLMPILAACASVPADYSVSKPSVEDEHAFSQTDDNIYGQWLPNGDLRVVLGYPLYYAAKLPVEDLKAEVSGDLITLHLAELSARAIKKDEPVPLCADIMKLTYVLHGLEHKAYRVLVAPTLYGHDTTEPIVPLVLK